MKGSIVLLAAYAALVWSSPAHAGEQENKRTAERVFLEKMNQGRFDIAPAVYATGFVSHSLGRDHSLAEDDASTQRFRAAFPDIVIRVERIVAEEDLVAVHWRGTGTNSVATGPFPGLGRKVTLDGMSFFRFQNGKIAEEWSTYDNLSILRQVGALSK